MKKFNLTKGLVIGLLTLALCLTGFAAVKASAAAGDEHTITFRATNGLNGDDRVVYAEYELTYKEGAAAVVAGWYETSATSPLKQGQDLVWIKNGDNAVTSGTYTIDYALVGTDMTPTWTVKKDGAAVDGYTTNYQGTATVIVTYKAASAAVDANPKEITLTKVLEELGKVEDVIYVKGTGSIGSIADKVDYDNGSGDLSKAKFTISNKANLNYGVDIPVETPLVSFTITVSDMLHTGVDSEEGTYKFTADTKFQKAKATLTFADILAGMEKWDDSTSSYVKVDGENVRLADPTAWVVTGFASNQPNYAKLTVGTSFDKITLKEQLTGDLSFNFTVSNSKVPVKFSYDGYTAQILVDNKKADNKIPFMNIVDNLKKDFTENGETVTKTYAEVKGESVILSSGFAAAEETVTGKYADWAYKYSLAAPTNSAPAVEAINGGSIVDAFETNGYDPDTDSISFVSPVELTLYWVDCKSTKGVQVKGDKVNTLGMTKNKTTNKYEASIVLYDKSAGVKNAESKVTYIYASYRTPADDKTKYTANYIVDATPYKKIAVTYAYAQAEKDSTAIAINSVTTIGTDKKTHIYAGDYNAETNKDYYLAAILGDLQYSEDGTTWYDVVDTDHQVNGKTVNNSFTLGKLYDLVNGGSKTTLYFRIVGARAQAAVEALAEDNPATTDYDETEGKPAKNAYRATKAVKVAVDAAKAGKAVKVNGTTGTIALKNGYDFTITEKEKDTPLVSASWTILPFNKDGKATMKKTVDGEAVDVATDIIATTTYAPVNKVTENASMFTATKVKAYSIEKLVTTCGKSIGGYGNLYIWIRKSATAKKPAEQWTLITVAQMTEAPTIKEDKNKFYAVQELDDTKGIVKGIEVSNAKKDSNSGSYEYLIVDASDIVLGEDSKYHADIDLTTAKWTALSDKGLTVAKSKSKYSKEEGKKATDHVLKDGSAVLIRRAGDKNGLLASDYIVTMITKQDVTYKDADNKDQSKALFVWKAFTAAE